jgi:hypothetical protein
MSNKNVNILSSSENVDEWIPLELELPIPFMDVLLYSANEYIYRVGYWDPVNEKIAISSVKLDNSSDETIIISDKIAEYNPKFGTATHWRYLPSQPTLDNTSKIPSECKTINEILDSENFSINKGNELLRDWIDS